MVVVFLVALCGCGEMVVFGLLWYWWLYLGDCGIGGCIWVIVVLVVVFG